MRKIMRRKSLMIELAVGFLVGYLVGKYLCK